MIEEKNNINGKTILLNDKGLDYRKKVIGIISMVNSHCSMPKIANTLNLTYKGLKKTFEQNERLPRPFDYDKWDDEKAEQSDLFLKKKKNRKKSDETNG